MSDIEEDYSDSGSEAGSDDEMPKTYKPDKKLAMSTKMVGIPDNSDNENDEDDEDNDSTADSLAESGDDDDSDLENIDDENAAEEVFNEPKTTKKSRENRRVAKTEEAPQLYDFASDDEDEPEDDDETGEKYLQKFDEFTKQATITQYHPELLQHNHDEIETLCNVVRDTNGVIADPLHRTLPFLTKYEKARILGERAKQIDAGATPLIKVDDNLIDSYLIAVAELEQKRIPFIVKRPLPNGGCEYWKLKDLEFI